MTIRNGALSYLNGTGTESTSIGTARTIDQLGRLVVPAELRRMIGLDAGTLVDFRFVDGDIVISKVQPECALCGSTQDLTQRHGKGVCRECVREIRDEPLDITSA
jgi:transcriptional pleiotropic regulator of transition state genes